MPSIIVLEGEGHFYRCLLRARAHWPLCLATGCRVFVADPSTLGRHVAATCMLCMQTLCLWRGRPQPVAHLSHKMQCAHQSLKIMVSYGNKYPRHNARPHVVEQSGQCARALMLLILWCTVSVMTPYILSLLHKTYHSNTTVIHLQHMYHGQQNTLYP